MSAETNERFNAEILKTLEEKRSTSSGQSVVLAVLTQLEARLSIVERQLAAIAHAFDSNSEKV